MDKKLGEKCVFSYFDDFIMIETEDKKIFWDLESFRPSPERILEKSKSYECFVHFKKENLTDDVVVSFPFSIYMNSGVNFINIR